jgi:hypothetical protein
MVFRGLAYLRMTKDFGRGVSLRDEGTSGPGESSYVAMAGVMGVIGLRKSVVCEVRCQ